jgi:ubiquinol-cytochrome c reductase iron-sulfur subunit
MPGQPQKPERRDILATAAYAMAGIGATLSLWPLIAALAPAADSRARRATFDLKQLDNTSTRSVWAIGPAPMLIFKRTPEELRALQNPIAAAEYRDPATFSGEAYRDKDSEKSNQPEWAQNWHRSLKPELMICLAFCTHDRCIIKRDVPEAPVFRCPCCGSRFDLAGRTFNGPATSNLTVPNYRYISETEIEFADYRVDA